MSAQRDDSSAADQFWLLTGDVPIGPFIVAQIHAKLAAGDATWQTSACLVGGGKWLPLVQTPGIGPGVPRSGSQPVPASSDPKTELKPISFQQDEPPPLPLDSYEETQPALPLTTPVPPAEKPSVSLASPPTNSGQTPEWVNELEETQYDASAGRFVWKMKSRKPEPTDDFARTVWKAIVLDAQIKHVRFEVGDGVQLQLWSNGTQLAKQGTRLKRPGDGKDILDRVIVEAEIPVEIYKRIDEATYNARP